MGEGKSCKYFIKDADSCIIDEERGNDGCKAYGGEVPSRDLDDRLKYLI